MKMKSFLLSDEESDINKEQDVEELDMEIDDIMEDIFGLPF